MGKKYHSPSSINTYLRCPRKYYLKYIERLQQKPSIYLVRGKAVHEAIARFSSLAINDLDDFESMKVALLGFLDAAWQKQREDIEKLSLPDEDLNQFYRESVVMLLGWLHRFRRESANGFRRPDTEVKLFSNRYRVMGIIDAIKKGNGQVTLVDYKTSKKDEITPDIKVQMGVYALLHQENFGVRPDVVAIDFLKSKTERRFRVTECLIEQAKDICRLIHQKTASMDKKDYPCTCGGYCQRDFVNA